MAENEVVWLEEPPIDDRHAVADEPGSSQNGVNDTESALPLEKEQEPTSDERPAIDVTKTSKLASAMNPPEPSPPAMLIENKQGQQSGEKTPATNEHRSSSPGGSEKNPDTGANQSGLTNESPSYDGQQLESTQRSVRWADGIAKSEDKSSTNLQLDVFERKMKESNKEALGLVDKLSQLNSSDPTSEPKSKADKGAPPAPDQRPPCERPLTNGWSSDLQVDSYRINPDLMKQPIDVVMLESAKLFLLDDVVGATLLHLESKNALVAKSFGSKWKNPKCACAVRGGKQEILVLAEYGSEGPTDQQGGIENGEIATLVVGVVDTKYDMQICRFGDQLHLVERVEAPKFLRDKVVVTCHLCHVGETNCIYLAANTSNDTYLYELSPDCRWAEIRTVRGRTHSDIEPLAVIGPVTELLLVESNRQYVQLMSVYNSEVVAQRMIAVAERPDALSIDEKGNFFVFDKATSKVALYSKVYFDKIRDVAAVERAKCRISAYGGLLAVLAKNFTELKVYKY